MMGEQESVVPPVMRHSPDSLSVQLLWMDVLPEDGALRLPSPIGEHLEVGQKPAGEDRRGALPFYSNEQERSTPRSVSSKSSGPLAVQL